MSCSVWKVNEAHRECHRVWVERRAASWDLWAEITSLELHVADTMIFTRVWAECPVIGWRSPWSRRETSEKEWGCSGMRERACWRLAQSQETKPAWLNDRERSVLCMQKNED